MDPVDHIRKRPGMYIGETGEAGLVHMVLEVVSNAFDVVLGGVADRITVDIDSEGAIVVSDNGPGFHSDHAFLEQVLTQMSTSPTRDDHYPHIHLSFGVGLVVPAALCRRLEVETTNAEVTTRCVVEAGRLTEPASTRASGGGATGTTLRLWPDPLIFENIEIDRHRLSSQLRNLTLLHHGLSANAFGEEYEPTTDLVPILAADWKPHWANGLDDALTHRRVVGDTVIELAMACNGFQGPLNQRTYCNYRQMVENGYDKQGVIEGFRLVLGQAPVADALKGTELVLHVLMLDPHIGGPTKSRLDNPEALWLVADTIAEALPPYLRERPELDQRLRSQVHLRPND